MTEEKERKDGFLGRVAHRCKASYESHPLAYGVGGLLFILLCNSYIGYQAATSVVKKSETIARTAYATRQLKALLAEFGHAEASQKDYLFTGDGTQLTNYGVNVYGVRSQLNSLSDELNNVPSQQVNLLKLVNAISMRLRELDAESDLYLNGDIEGARALVKKHDLWHRSGEIRAIADDMEFEQERLQQEQDRLRKRYQSSLTLTFWLSTFINIALIWRMATLVRGILKTLEREKWREYRHALEANARKDALEREMERRRQAESEVQELNAQLERRVEERTRELTTAYQEAESFNYSISHDLRAPLRAIVSSSRILMDDYGSELNPLARHELQRQVTAANRLAKLIDDLLMLSRLSRQEMIVTPLDLGEVAREVANELKDRGWKVAPRFDVQSDLYTYGDGTLARLLLVSLMENACKFSPQGAHVEIGVDRRRDEDVFFVRDYGLGFDDQYAHKLFLPFERLVTDAEFEGTGIGLAHAKRIVERHGGRIWAESVKGQGSTFYFTFGSRAVAEIQNVPAQNRT